MKRARSGFTLLETLLALSLLAITVAVVAPAFVGNLAVNTRQEWRLQASAVAQEVLDGVRRVPTGALPTSGTGDPIAVSVGGRTYQAVLTYCARAAWCDDASRHVRVQVFLDQAPVFEAETVFTEVSRATP